MLKPLYHSALHAAAVVSLLFAPQAAWAQEAPAQAQPATTQPTTTQAAPAPTPIPADPALWVVRDRDTTIYLFGTVHVLKPGMTWFDGPVRAAFDASDTLVLEIVRPEDSVMQNYVIQHAINMNGPTVTEQLPEDHRAAYAAALATMNLPPAAFDRLDPWAVALTLSLAPLSRLGYDPASGAEEVLTQAAHAADKPIVGLETMEQQIGYFDDMAPALQITYLVNTLDQFDNIGPMIEKMITDWAAGNVDALGADLNSNMLDTPEMARILLTERNQRWADWIKARLEQPGTVFVAVGAGHLAGDNDVQHYLEAQGVHAERIAY